MPASMAALRSGHMAISDSRSSAAPSALSAARSSVQHETNSRSKSPEARAAPTGVVLYRFDYITRTKGYNYSR